MLLFIYLFFLFCHVYKSLAFFGAMVQFLGFEVHRIGSCLDQVLVLNMLVLHLPGAELITFFFSVYGLLTDLILKSIR